MVGTGDIMSGARGAQPPGTLTPTAYESVPEERNRTRLDPRSKEDEGMIRVDKLQDKVVSPAADDVNQARTQEKKPDTTSHRADEQ
ncbi:hypothetical protein ZIOFF_072339 [Zingiber officinale]|uniref:Uncharacterized protein n=1 Tax=Zingiber officinale TaxID=94328 RepID=A0A8J5CVB9_ZINOF|nr:hypothetical protein ZIOFF_072339 [Zingiber officinale]